MPIIKNPVAIAGVDQNAAEKCIDVLENLELLNKLLWTAHEMTSDNVTIEHVYARILEAANMVQARIESVHLYTER